MRSLLVLLFTDSLHFPLSTACEVGLSCWQYAGMLESFETFAMWFVKGDINVQLLGKRGVYLAHVLSSDMNQVLDHNWLICFGRKRPCNSILRCCRSRLGAEAAV